jgi:hypothetical protein
VCEYLCVCVCVCVCVRARVCVCEWRVCVCVCVWGGGYFVLVYGWRSLEAYIFLIRSEEANMACDPEASLSVPILSYHSHFVGRLTPEGVHTLSVVWMLTMHSITPTMNSVALTTEGMRPLSAVGTTTTTRR